MTSADPSPTRDPDEPMPPDHPAGTDQTVSAGEVLSGRGRAGGTIARSEGRSRDDESASDVGQDEPADSEPGDPSHEDHRRRDVDDSDSIVDDAIEFFTAGGDDDSPAADSDAPAPG